MTIGKVWRLILAALLGTGAGYGTISAQGKSEIELVSKADAIRLFKLTKQQWLQEIRAAVSSGQAVATGGDPQIPGMSTTTPEGDILVVRVDYSKDDRKPLFIQVMVGYRQHRAKLFTDGNVKDAIVAAQRQMAPEFEVVANADRIEGGLAFFIQILEAGR